MSLSVSSLSSGRYAKKLLAFLKGWENAPLIGHDAGPAGAIHDDSTHIPTVGYGFNLLALTKTGIERAFKYALTGDIHGSLGSRQQQGIDLLQDWRGSASTATTSANLHLISISQGDSGSTADRKALKSLWLSDDDAGRLLDARLNGEPGLFDASLEDQLATRLASLGASLPGNSYEKLALMSLYFNSPSLIGPGVAHALDTGNHAQLWYEIRYNHLDYASKGVENRREAESNLIGILDPEHRDSPHQALKALDFLFDRDGGSASVYEKIATRDAVINATDPGDAAEQSFAARIDPYLDLVSHKYAHGHNVDFVQIGTGGRDRIKPGAAEHTGLTKGHTDDLVKAKGGNDKVGTGGGGDSVHGGAGDDVLRLGSGNDHAWGNSGKDKIDGGRGDDVLRGGSGRDVFIFGPNDGTDKIKDFHHHKDDIDLSDFGFSSKVKALHHFSKLDSHQDVWVFHADHTTIKIYGLGDDHITKGDILI